MDRYAATYLRKRKIPSTACSGCGLGQIHKKIIMAIDELGLGSEDVVWGTGIGCAGRQTFNTWNGDNFAGTHGRVYALASGLRMALPSEKKIIITAGDGDAFGIGISHLLNCARRNVDITVIVCDNFGYQSTGGQFGYTTPKGYKTDSSPYGMVENNFLQGGVDILNILRDAGATFLARYSSFDGHEAVEGIKKAIENHGFSLVHIIYPCVTNFGGAALKTRNPQKVYEWFSTLSSNDPNRDEDFNFKFGVFFDASGSKPEYSDVIKELTLRVRENLQNGQD